MFVFDLRLGIAPATQQEILSEGDNKAERRNSDARLSSACLMKSPLKLFTHLAQRLISLWAKPRKSRRNWPWNVQGEVSCDAGRR